MQETQNIAKRSIGINTTQLVAIILATTQAVFWGTSYYKDLKYESHNIENNSKNIIETADQAKRRISNESKTLTLKAEINHLKLTHKIEIQGKDKDIDILKMKLDFCQKQKTTN